MQDVTNLIRFESVSALLLTIINSLNKFEWSNGDFGFEYTHAKVCSSCIHMNTRLFANDINTMLPITLSTRLTRSVALL